MAVFNRNQDSYETIEGITQRAAKQVKKAVTKTATAVVGDVKQSLGLEASPDNTGVQTTSSKSQTAMNSQITSSNEDKQKLAQTRANLEKINQEIKRIREEREKKAQQANQEKQAKQAEKKQVDERKKENAFQKMLKAKKGTKESMSKVSG